MYSSLYFAMVVISHFYFVGVTHARLTLSLLFWVGLFRGFYSKSFTARPVPGLEIGVALSLDTPIGIAAAWLKCASCRKTSRPKLISTSALGKRGTGKKRDRSDKRESERRREWNWGARMEEV